MPSVTTIRIGPAAIILLLQVSTIGLSVTSSINNTQRFGYMILGPAVCFLLFSVWLLGFSQLKWKERLFDWLVALGLGVGAARIADPSMGVPLWIYGVPLAMSAITLGIWFGRRMRSRQRMALVLLFLTISWGTFVGARLEGFTGDYHPELVWRWSHSAEERLGRSSNLPGTSGSGTDGLEVWQLESAEWPGFRGPRGDSASNEIGRALDWKSHGPREAWRVAIGPGWSSFACASGRLFTQEQQGDMELVTCLDAETGTRLWQSKYANRFSDVVSGAGPRATPTISDGHLYTYGGKAVLTCLDAVKGSTVWRHDLMAELGAPLPVWGFSSSPVVAGGAVIVYAGAGEKGWVAYGAESGELVWSLPQTGMNFSSAQLHEIDGDEWLILNGTDGIVAVDPTSGKSIWSYKPSGWQSPAMVQPHGIGPGKLIVALGDGIGLARLDVERGETENVEWVVTERWSSRQLKPSFNDFVYFEDHCYGFDQNIFVCLDASNGVRKWKRGRYGFGQVILLRQARQLLVLSESGELVLLQADPSEHRELGRVPAIKGKTWNHPAVAGGKLFVRNGEEAACFDLSMTRAEAH